MQIDVSKEIVMLPITDIKPYKKNPRKHDKTVEALVNIIPKVGFNVPLVVDKNHVIVKGHARYEAANRLGLKELPCIITNASEEAIKADRIADNKLSEFSEWVNDELLHELDMLTFDFDFTSVGLPNLSFDYNIPTFAPVEYEYDYSDNMTDDERKKLYEEFLNKEKEKEEEDVVFVTDKAIKRAKVDLQTITPKRDYRKCICKKCGNVLYVDANVLYGKDGVVRR